MYKKNEKVGTPVPTGDENKNLWKFIGFVSLVFIVHIGTIYMYSGNSDNHYRPDLEKQIEKSSSWLVDAKKENEYLAQQLSSHKTELSNVRSELKQGVLKCTQLEQKNLLLLKKHKEKKKKKHKTKRAKAPPVKKKPKAIKIPKVVEKPKDVEKPHPAIAELAQCQRQCKSKDEAIANLKKASTDQHLEISKMSESINELNAKLGDSKKLLLQKRMNIDRVRLEMTALIARDEKHWGELVPTVVGYYHCIPATGEVVKLYRIGEDSPTIEIPLTGSGGNMGPHFTRRVHQVPCGLYMIELWKNNQLFRKCTTPGYFSPTPRISYVIRPDGSRVAIAHPDKKMNVIVITGKGYDSSPFATSR